MGASGATVSHSVMAAGTKRNATKPEGPGESCGVLERTSSAHNGPHSSRPSPVTERPHSPSGLGGRPLACRGLVAERGDHRQLT
jgi:hypothetical protein